MQTLLFDFDGVLIKNNKIEKIIEEKSIEYVSRKLKNHSNPEKLNRSFYKKYGHTAIGLKHFIQSETTIDNAEFIQDYNKFVFSNIDYNDFTNHIDKKDIVHINRLFSISGNYYSNVGIFTNAPSTWCENICKLMDIDIYDHIEDNLLFTSDEGLSKPLYDTYKNVEDHISNDIIFIDDSISNLIPVIHREKWNVYLQNNWNRENLYTFLLTGN
jgi:FMN phosphatase YigB (HAD superfamily)